MGEKRKLKTGPKIWNETPLARYNRERARYLYKYKRDFISFEEYEQLMTKTLEEYNRDKPNKTLKEYEEVKSKNENKRRNN